MSMVHSKLEYAKHTDNKVRFDGIFEDSVFEFYIPKSRLPTPWPRRIVVGIEAVDSITVPPNTGGFNEAKISAVVYRNTEHTKTVRFTPAGDAKEWEIGEPYVPYCLLPDPAAKYLKIEVRWNRSEGESPEITQARQRVN